MEGDVRRRRGAGGGWRRKINLSQYNTPGFLTFPGTVALSLSVGSGRGGPAEERGVTFINVTTGGMVVVRY